MNEGTGLLSTEQLAKALGIHQYTAQRLCREGKLPAVYLSGNWYIKLSVLLQRFGVTEVRVNAPEEVSDLIAV